MNPEQSAIRSLDRQKRVDQIQEMLNRVKREHPKIESALKNMAFSPENFRDLYGDKSIEDDQSYVQRKQGAFSQSDKTVIQEGLTSGDIKKLSKRAEYEIIRGINVARWLPLMKAYKTAEVDDIGRGVDIVLEVTDSELIGHLGLGVDITFAQDIDKKFRRIRDEICAYDGNRNKLARVKYFQSNNFRGELSDICRLVLVIDLPMLEDLTKLRNKQLKNHMARHEILMEMNIQLDAFARFAQKRNPKALNPIIRTHNFIRNVIAAIGTERTLSDSQYFKNRKANQTMLRGLELFRM